jgi:hypothetical protein
MTDSAQRPEKPESRDGCPSRMFSLQLQKSPTPDFDEKCGNSPDISKGISQLGIYKFESSQVAAAVVLPYFSVDPDGKSGGPLHVHYRMGEMNYTQGTLNVPAHSDYWLRTPNAGQKAGLTT